MDYGYSTLIEEVRTTNDLLEEQNATLNTISSCNSLLVLYLVCLAILKGADILHHIFDATYKRK